MASDPTPGTDPVERAGDIRALADLLAGIELAPDAKLRGEDPARSETLDSDRAEAIRKAAFLAAVMTSGRGANAEFVTHAAREYEAFLTGPVAITGGDAKVEVRAVVGRSLNAPSCPGCKAATVERIGVYWASGCEHWKCAACKHEWTPKIGDALNHVELQA